MWEMFNLIWNKLIHILNCWDIFHITSVQFSRSVVSHFLIIMNNAPINIPAQGFVRTYCFLFVLHLGVG